MSSHTFHKIYLHINWHCLGDRPLIVPAIEPELYNFITNYCRELEGIIFHAIGGTADHIHLALQMEPKLSVSEVVGKTKGASAHYINKRFGNGKLEWQRGFGVVSFAEKNLPGILRYVADQKKHHSTGTTKDVLENGGSDLPFAGRLKPEMEAR